MAETAIWLDLTFEVHHPDRVRWNEVPGVYVFAGLDRFREWSPLYVGQTGSLAERLTTHEKWSEASRLGATHIHVRVVQDEESRLALEERLIHAYHPQMNR